MAERGKTPQCSNCKSTHVNVPNSSLTLNDRSDRPHATVIDKITEKVNDADNLIEVPLANGFNKNQ